MKKYIHIFSAFLIGIIFVSCEKTITIKALPYQDQLSIECLLVPGEEPKLFLNKSVAYFSAKVNNIDLFIADASVKISSDGITDILSPSSERNAFLCQDEYFYLGKIKAQMGKTYKLEVTYKGQTYTAETTINQSKPKLNSVDYTQKFNDVYGEHEGIILNFNDTPNEINNYRFLMVRQVDSTVRTANNKVYKTECNGANKFTVIEVGRSVYSDQNKNGLAMSFVVEPAYTHKQGQTAKVYVQTIDARAADFFDALDRQKLATYNPFVEPVFLKTQIAGCIGVFGSMNISEPIDFVYPE
jgi:hypothetical protein